jgi:hypothetical protein
MKLGAAPYALEATHAVQATHANDGIPVGMIAVFLQTDPETPDGCPPGWERATELDGLFVRGAAADSGPGTAPAGADSVTVGVSVGATSNAVFGAGTLTSTRPDGTAKYCPDGYFLYAWWNHDPWRTDEEGDCLRHTHGTSTTNVAVPTLPRHRTVLYCRFVGE